MSDSPVYWSQPNQQVVRNGEPVGVLPDDPDPQTTSSSSKAKSKKAEPVPELEEAHVADE